MISCHVTYPYERYHVTNSFHYSSPRPAPSFQSVPAPSFQRVAAPSFQSAAEKYSEQEEPVDPNAHQSKSFKYLQNLMDEGKGEKWLSNLALLNRFVM